MSFKEIVDKYENKNTKTTEYKNSFSTYQDMIDGDCVMECSDDDNEYSYTESESETEELKDNEDANSETEKVDNDSEEEEDVTDYEELMNSIQKVEESNNVLQREVKALNYENKLIIVSLYFMLLLLWSYGNFFPFFSSRSEFIEKGLW